VSFELKLLASVRVCALALSLVCVAFPTLTFVLLCDHQIVRARGSKCGDSSRTGYSETKRNTVVFKWVFGPLERG
jgi:hypothetical protein